MWLIAEPFYLTSAFAFIILMMILMLMPQPRGDEWRPFRKSMHYVKIAYGIMTALNIVQCFEAESPPHEYGIYVLIIGFYQALCFTMCFRRLLDPRSSLHKFLHHLVCVTIGAVIVFCVHFFAPHIVCCVVYWIYLAAYVCTGIYYVYMSYTGWRDCVNRLSDYYDEDMADRMRWLRRLMWMVFAVGVLALLTSLWVVINPVFVIVYTLAYAYFLVCIIRYAYSARFIVRSVTEEAVTPETTEAVQETAEVDEAAQCDVPVEEVPKDRESQLEFALRKWKAEKQYLTTDVGIDEIAEQLGTTYNFLTSYFQKHEGITFREWRIRLRIEEAQRLLLQDTSMSISDVLEKSGFHDRTNFHRNFTRIVGCSPSAYRKGANGKDIIS